MEGFVKLIAADEVGPGEMQQVEVDGHAFLVAHVGDDYYVADEHCPHLGGPLAKGTIEGTTVTCPWHHSQFDLTDGHCVRWTNWTGAVLQVGELMRHPRPLRVYETQVEDGSVWVGPQREPPAPATAD